MPRPKRTPSFVCEFRLRVERHEAKSLERFFELGRLLYNTLLQEALRRLELLVKSELYLSAMSALKAWHAERKALLASTPSVPDNFKPTPSQTALADFAA